MEPITYSFAALSDGPAIKSLLFDCNLPEKDLAPHMFENFIVAKIKNDIIGAVGIEIYNAWGLLRSLCVKKEYRARGIGCDLYTRMVEYAVQKGVKELFLLTTTAQHFFAVQGFIPVCREEAPQPIRMTQEVRNICPLSAVCMSKILIKS